ncbi:MAG: DegT/DnrJ/EryC1/StrS family aminotransferase [Ignavibacteriales bacterium]|nr:MAG: DegT/DnrJ/EryC1/StrS family aminotransferase [Ignavibacteriales bacterium]
MKKLNIPFHKPFITDDEIKEVVDTIKSGWWTTGPKAQQFEMEFNSYIGSKRSVVVNSWTAAAHLSLEAIGIKEGDEVIVPSITFTASAEIVCYFKAIPVIVDVDPVTLNISPSEIEKAVTKKTRAIIPVHYGGMPCDMDEIMEIAKKSSANGGLKVIEDAAHALPAYYKDKMIGRISDVTCFSFYVTKTLATGEGGMICTDDEEIADRCKVMRLHGISHDPWNRYTDEGSWYYEVISAGYKYNFTDIQAALGIAQLKKLDAMLEMRKAIAAKYDEAFKSCGLLEIPTRLNDRESAYHLYPIRLNLEKLKINRSQFINEIKNAGIGSSVHFIPLYRHPFYKNNFNPEIKNYPVSENEYPRLVSLPIFPGMTDEQIDYLSDRVLSILKSSEK